MGALTLVEVMDRRGRVRARVKVEALPFRIGRGYDCDLILDDPHVSALHAVLERGAEGGLVLRDAGSRNGLFLDGSRQRVERVALDGDVSVQLGRTLLRLRAPDFPVPEALPIVPRSSFTEWLLEHWSAAIVVPALALSVLVLDAWRRSTAPFEPADVLSTVAREMLVFGAWVGSWSLLNRLLRQRSRFVAHSTVAFGVSTLFTLSQWGFEWLRFLVEPVEPLRIADLGVDSAFWSLALLGHLTVMGVALRRLRLIIVGAFFGAILSVQLLEHYASGIDWVVTLPYWSRLEPVDPSWLQVESPEAFFGGIDALGRELEDLATEAMGEDAGEATAPASEPVGES